LKSNCYAKTIKRS